VCRGKDVKVSGEERNVKKEEEGTGEKSPFLYGGRTRGWITEW